MPVVDVGTGSIAYRCDGPAGAPVLVLSNSLGTTLSMWEPQAAAFARRFRVVRYDSRGHGGSAVTPGPYTIEQLGRDVVGLLDRLEIKWARLCGLSMGGMVALWLVAHAPERIDRLALCNTAARIGPPDQWNARIAAVRRGGMAAVAATVVERWFTPAFVAREPTVADSARQHLLHTAPDGYCACCAAVRDADMRPLLSQVRAPTLVIAGTHDRVTPPADGRLLAAAIPDARYVELDAAHLSNIEAAAPFTDAVLHFLSA